MENGQWLSLYWKPQLKEKFIQALVKQFDMQVVDKVALPLDSTTLDPSLFVENKGEKYGSENLVLGTYGT